MPSFRGVLFVFLFSPLLLGCDDEERRLRSWQQQQVTELQRQSAANSAAAQALVEADAASRHEFLVLEQAVQAERKALAEQCLALERDRKALDAYRQNLPLAATLFRGFATLVLGIVALWICGRLLVDASSDEGAAELEETLILSVVGELSWLSEEPRIASPPTGSSLLASAPAESAPAQE